MVRIILIIIGCIIGFNLYGQNLERHTWENRILIVKSKDGSSNKYQKQIEVFKNSAEQLRDRKLVLYQIVGSKYKLTDYKNLDQKKSGEISVSIAKEILNEKNQFEIILIGLDGNIKLQKTELLTKEELFNRIDSMPMRKAELKNRNGKN